MGVLLAAADVFVLPSLWEGAAGALIEALAMGVPIVATDMPGLREFLDEGVHAEFAAVGDSSMLAAKIIRVVEDQSLRERMRQANLALFEEKFSLSASAEALAQLYEALVVR